MSVTKYIKRYWPTGLVVATILYATWLPAPIGDETLPSIPNIDKWIHAAFGFGLVCALAFDNFRAGVRLSLTRLLVLTLCAMAAMAVDEVVQGLLPIGRPSDAMDLLADWAGTAIGALAGPAVLNLFRK
mgnify:CR=1 FL=1